MQVHYLRVSYKENNQEPTCSNTERKCLYQFNLKNAGRKRI